MANRKTGRAHNKHKQTGIAILPGSYEIVQIDFNANNGQKFNIVDLVGQIKIFESLNAASLEVQLYILDAGNYFEKLKIGGNERIDITLARRDIKGELTTKSIEVYVANMNYFKKGEPGKVTYILSCVSKHAYMNQLQRVSKPFSGSPGVLVQKLVEDELKVELQDPKNISKSTKQIITGVYPRMHPITLINWLQRRSYDNGTPFFFYDTLANGVMFQSIEDMRESHILGYDEDQDTYNHIPFQREFMPGGEDHYETQRTRILNLNTDNMSISKFKGIGRGAYSSTLHKLDISNKKYTCNTQYQYSKKIKPLNRHKPLSDNVKFDDRKIENYTEAKHFYLSLNDLSHGNKKNYHDPAADSILQAYGYIGNLESNEITVQVHGDFEIASGKKLNIVVRKGVDRARTEESDLDMFLSGIYIVHSIQHEFAENFLQTITLRKDSYIESVDNIITTENTNDTTT